MLHDVLIIGGGPSGLSAALALGRARKHVVLVDGGPRRNALAVHIQNFVTRDGTPPDDFRRIAREQLAAYPTVTIVDGSVPAIAGSHGAFRVTIGAETITARRILLATGMVDEMLPIEGFRDLWGHSIFQCPYCHGYEVRDRRWAFLANPSTATHLLPFALMIRGWTSSVTVFTNGALELPDATRARLEAAGLRIETAPIARLVADGTQLTGIALTNGAIVPADALFTHPPQRQTDLVRSLDLALDEGYVKVDPLKPETSTPGVYASGDLTTRGQAAILAAASGLQAAAALNVDLALDRA